MIEGFRHKKWANPKLNANGLRCEERLLRAQAKEATTKDVTTRLRTMADTKDHEADLREKISGDRVFPDEG